MNHTIASCGCSVISVGAPGSMARRAQERRPCDKPRCRSGLPKKFTDEECEAYCRLLDSGVMGWIVDLLTKRVDTHQATYKDLVEFAKAKGMQ